MYSTTKCPYCGNPLVIAHRADLKAYSFICHACPMHFRVTDEDGMTLDEAIEAFRKHDWSQIDEEEKVEDKKDVGVKPRVTGIHAKCGSCGCSVSLYEVDFSLGYKFNFCNNCGERIDWGDLEKLVYAEGTKGGSDIE